MKKIILCTLSPFLMYGQITTELQCVSLSGDTYFKVHNTSFSNSFQKAKLTIEDKSLTYARKDSNNRVVNRLNDGVFTLSYEDSKKKILLHALPKSIKKIESKIIKANYIFNAIISNLSTDPRKLISYPNDASLAEDIKVECTFFIGSDK